MASNEVRRAKRTFFKGDVRVAKGQLVRVGHDVMQGCEELFEKLGVDFDTPKEEAPKAAAPAAAPAGPADKAPETKAAG